MSDRIWQFVYTLFVVYPLYPLVYIASVFSSKLRRGIRGRKVLFEKLKENLSKVDPSLPIVWFHASSQGEFEQAKPIIEKLKSEKKVTILATFFSPSGYENSLKYKPADIVSYLPFDFTSQVKKFVEIVKPSVIIVMRYDIWPNHIWYIAKQDIPMYLVDATMKRNSARKNSISKHFHTLVYKKFKKILTVSPADAKGFRDFDYPESLIQVAGDTRYDRVYERSITARERQLLRNEVTGGKKVFIAGSSWHEDEEVIIPAIKKLIKSHPEFLVVIVPHEPTIQHLENLEREFQPEIPTKRFSYLNNYKNEQVILVDSIGILLSLYTYADFAFVGGSFKSNVHNVLEAAVYGIPVAYGPKIQGSQEAPALIEAGGGFLIQNKKQALRLFKTFLEDDSFRKEKGELAKTFVHSRTGATRRILDEIIKEI